MEMEEIKSLLEKQGEAWSAFKDTMETEIKSLKNKDPIVEEKLSRIEKFLDDAVESKAKLETALEAERK